MSDDLHKRIAQTIYDNCGMVYYRCEDVAKAIIDTHLRVERGERSKSDGVMWAKDNRSSTTFSTKLAYQSPKCAWHHHLCLNPNPALASTGSSTRTPGPNNRLPDSYSTHSPKRWPKILSRASSNPSATGRAGGQWAWQCPHEHPAAVMVRCGAPTNSYGHHQEQL